MAKFSNIVRGTRALKPIEFEIWGTTARCSVRALSGMEEGDALAAGRAYAVSKGIAEPKETDRLYEIGVMAATLWIACVDSDAPTTPYFSSLAEVLEHLNTDLLAYLYELQQFWQDECSPRITKLGSAEWIALVIECAEAAQGKNPLVRLRPSTREIFVATLASRFINSLSPKSDTGTNSAPSTSEIAPQASEPAS